MRCAVPWQDPPRMMPTVTSGYVIRRLGGRRSVSPQSRYMQCLYSSYPYNTGRAVLYHHHGQGGFAPFHKALHGGITKRS